MIYKSLNFRLLNILFFFLLTFNLSAEPNVDDGKKLFKTKCATCHNKSMVDDMTGPALAGSQARWDDDEKLYSWIRNSQALIDSGDKYAVELFTTWKTAMTSFPDLTDDQIGSILSYITCVETGPCGKTVKDNGDGGAVAKTESKDNTLLYATLLFILGILSIVLARIISSLNHMTALKAGLDPGPKKSLLEILTSRGVIAFLIFALVVLGGYTTVNNAINLGRQQGYQPDQPIKFSHVTHAGVNKIDCQYCHDGARRSKHSFIPAANTCMNCHKAIKTGSKYGTAEISKIYASIGFDPNTDKYIDNYDELEEEEIATVYKEWISAQYMNDNDLASLNSKGERVVKKQWADIKASLTNETKDKIQGPIEWIRVHNLPDHVYFNHAQHVIVGEVECQNCHGKVEDMEVVEQYAPLSMGWCINCHRETPVKFADNEYYDSYETYHEELKDKTREKVTVEDIGGTECQKCHY